MKILLLFVALVFSSASNAQSPFNGVFCGRGIVMIQEQKYEGTKTVELSVNSTELHLKRDHTDLDDGSYIDGRPEDAVISPVNIIYNGAAVGTTSTSELQTDTTIAGYKIAYTIKNSGAGFISYSHTSENGSFQINEDFPELKPCQ